MSQQKKLFLLDAMALIYRAYFALSKSPRMTSFGLNTSAIYGFANSLWDVIKNEKPTHLGVAFDSRVPTVRHEEFAEYKAHRQEMPEDIGTSLPYIRRLLDAFNIPVLIVAGYEADDIIGTIAKKAERNGFITYMMTPDKDFGQLVTDKSFIYKPGRMGDKPEILGVKEICEKYNIRRPEQVIDILGLMGDASDNIPGLPNVGEVTAKKLVEEFGSVENVLKNRDKMKGRLREIVENHAEQALFSKKMATIILDVPINFDEEHLRLSNPDITALKEIFYELEFRTFANRVFTDLSLKVTDETAEAPTQKEELFADVHEITEKTLPSLEKNTIVTTPHRYVLADTPETRQNLITDLIQQSSVCFDTETTGLDPNNSELIGISFSFKPHEAWYVTIPGNYHEACQVVNEFRCVFEDPSIEKIGQNLKFDISILKWYDMEVKGKLFDTMLAHYVIQPDLRHNMDFLSETYLNYKPVPIESLIGKKSEGQLSMRVIDIETVKDYSAEDADVTLQLKYVFEPMMQEANTRELFDTIEMPLVPVLAAMEAEGINIDPNVLTEYSVQLRDQIKDLERIIHEQAGMEFNISSPKQLGEVLYEKLQISGNPKLTKTKQYSTSEDVLQKMSYRHPIIQNILDYRSLTKLKSTYVDVLPALANPRTGRIHSSFNQAVAATGRLSSNNPNMQNIPVRTEKGREIRKAFVPRNSDYTLLSVDYSQIELRIIAEMSGDEGMIEAFRQGLDIHAATAARVFGVPLSEVNGDMRRKAKTVNFGIIYGISAFGLSERLNIPRKESADIIAQYFTQYPRIKQYMDDTIAFARANGYVETIMKRRRYIRDITSGNAVVRGFAERNAINAPIQGSAADMIKIAMISIFNELQKRGLRTKMILQVHDELVFDMPKDEANIIMPVIREKMTTAIPMRVQIDVEMKTGDNWLDAH
ncbi:MAG: DNA polymerase I [Bacteroidetes bacterium]|nr:DNA polymerase I [Bacteroidota bacterium]